MFDLSSIPFAFLLGSGGLTAIATAYFGWRSHREERREETRGFSAMFADRMAFERLAEKMERLTDVIERAIEKFEFYRMIEGLKRDK